MLNKRDQFFEKYLSEASVALSFWRAFECEKFSNEKIVHPVLDVGCGDGFFVKAAFGEKLEAGIDLDGREVKRAVRSGSYRKVIRGSVTDLPFPAKSFNTVISNCVLEHIPEIDKGLQEIARVLKRGGRLMITVPSECFNVATCHQEWLKFLGLRGLSKTYTDGLNKIFKHHHVDDAATWKKRFARVGLKLEKAEYFISIPAFHTYELWLFPAIPSKIWKLLFGRWVLFPRFWLKWFIPGMLKNALWSKSKKGVAYFLIARKG